MLPHQLLSKANFQNTDSFSQISQQDLIKLIFEQYQNSALLSLMLLLPVQNQNEENIQKQVECLLKSQEEMLNKSSLKQEFTPKPEIKEKMINIEEKKTKFKSEVIKPQLSSDEKKSKHKLLPSCIRKRLKTFLNNYIVNKINMLVSKMKSTLYVFNLPKQLIYNSKINSRNYLFNLKIKEIFSTNQCGVDDKRVQHNSKVMKEIEDLGDFEIVSFINKELKQVYFEYLESEQFLNSARNIKDTEGDEYFNSFIEISKNLLVRSYY